MFDNCRKTTTKDGKTNEAASKKTDRISLTRKQMKNNLFILSILLVFLLVGCGSNEKDNTSGGKNPTVGQTETQARIDESTEEFTEQVETEETDITSTEETENPTEDPKLEDFTIMDYYFKEVSFDVSFDEKLEIWDRIYSFSTSYDLDGDGVEDKIEALLNYYSESGESYVEVNGIRHDIQTINPADLAYIIDVDSRDNYSEIAFYDYGPSGDPVLFFYRYDGTGLYFIGEMDRNALMDGKGRFISWFNLANNFEPQFYSQWEEVTNNNLTIHPHNVEQYIDQTYLVSGEGYFIPFDTNPGDDFTRYTKFDPEDKVSFKDTEIKLIDILGVSTYTRVLNWYYVEMDDGGRGLMYFWIGD